ncbi:MAG: VTT domain-containing protein [Micropepsaceae bacterium]
MPDTDTSAENLPPRRRNIVLRSLVLAALAAGLIAVVIWRDSIDYQSIADWAQNHSWWETALEFVAVHIVAGLFFVPRLFLGLAAGALFGAVWGSLLAIIGGTAGAFVGFALVRFVNADAVKLREAPRIGPWLERAERQGWRFVLVVRLVPVLPHSLVNYVFGLSKVATPAYLLGSALGMVPTAIIYANLGEGGREAVQGNSNYALLAAWGFGLIFVSWLLPKLIARFWPQNGA